MTFAAGGGSTCSPLLHRKHRGDLPVPSLFDWDSYSWIRLHKFFSCSWRSACHFVCLVLAASILHSSRAVAESGRRRLERRDDACCLATHCSTCSTRQKKQNNSHTPNFPCRPRHRITNLSFFCLEGVKTLVNKTPYQARTFKPFSATGLSGPKQLNLCSLIPVLLWCFPVYFLIVLPFNLIDF